MAWPPPVLPITRANATAQLDTHPQDHNAINGAMNDTTTRLQALIAQVTTIESRTHDWTMVAGTTFIPIGTGWASVDLGVPVGNVQHVISSSLMLHGAYGAGGVAWMNKADHAVYLEGVANLSVAWHAGNPAAVAEYRICVFYNPPGTLLRDGDLVELPVFDLDELFP